MRFPTPVFMADISRAMSNPPPTPVQQPFAMQDKMAAHDAKRTEKNERDRLRRKAKRAADLKAAKVAEKKAAAPKRKRKKKKPTDIYDAMKAAAARNPMKKRRVGKSPALAAPYGKKRRRGRPPGAKNKPKVGLAVALVPAPGVLPRGRRAAIVPAQIEADAFGALNVAMNALYTLPVTKRIDVLTMLNRLFG